MTFAINVDPHNPDPWAQPSPTMLFEEGFRGARFTSRNTDGNRDYARECHDTGLRVLAIITEESHGYLVPGADVYQIGNEPDRSPTYMRPDEYYWELWKIYRETYPDFDMYMAGLSSGGLNAVRYAERVLALCEENGTRKPDAIAIHPYIKTSIEAAGEFDLMWDMAHIPVIATEWHQSAASTDMWDFVHMLNDPATGRSTVWNSYFCYADSMVLGLGLRASDGTPKDEYYSLLSAPSAGVAAAVRERGSAGRRRVRRRGGA
jgi:hypothetical protein